MFSIVLSRFEGSADELLFLIKRGRFSPLEVEIGKITTSYSEWIFKQNDISLEKSHVLLLLSELMLIKSSYLLPKQRAIEGVKSPIINDLKKYKTYKDAGLWIEERIKEQGGKHSIKLKIIKKKKGGEISLGDIFSLSKEILNKKHKKTLYELTLDKPSIEEVIERIKGGLISIKKIEITKLVDRKNTRELIVTFLAVLELIRLRFLKAIQYRAFSSIWIIKR